ncbi:2-oxoglutarate-dependent dioxygenase htyE [Exaiptasia diaphana]|uniref:Fe2OG dioxygenase domain-containing protein n=1 Tax=Exaiptasia diaphana TaxID=2652724 RepID=A0A913Y1R0_EXADI|nr:2-oxoglutarate-dependent dioxygenase htyE [Exaiptasia diaphana]
MGLCNDEIPCDSDVRVQKIASQICKAFSSIGFVYLKNHGISDDEIAKVRQVSDTFFALPVEEKAKCARDSHGTNHGWVALERESLNPDRPADLKEAFNVEVEHSKWPTSTVPDMKPSLEGLYDKCAQLAFRILKVIGIGLKIKSPDWLIKAHQNIGKPINSTAMRILYYPPITNDYVIKKDQVRCGEHSDYGSITLLFQDELGGLQVLPVHGDYIPAPTLPGCVIVNIGDLQNVTRD